MNNDKSWWRLPITHTFAGFWGRMALFGAVCSFVAIHMWELIVKEGVR